MKKYVGMALALICIVALTACGSDKKITLPELEKITEIEIIKNTSERGKKVTGKEEISKIISELKDNSESTKKESVSDEPTNTEDYICIKFYHDNADDSPSIVYLYKYFFKTSKPLF